MRSVSKVVLFGGSIGAVVAGLAGLPGWVDETERVDVAESAATANPGDVTVSWTDLHQKITGFGASSAWVAQNIPDADADFAFGSSGLWLSLLRVRIDRAARPGRRPPRRRRS